MSSPEASSSYSQHPQYANQTDLTALLIFIAFCCCCFAVAKIVIYVCDQRYGGLQIATQPAQDTPDGLNSESLEALQVGKFQRTISGNNAECSICLGQLEEEDPVRVMLCIHQFHQECIDTWLQSHSTCPICRANADPLKPEDVAEEPESAGAEEPASGAEQPASGTTVSSVPETSSASATHLDHIV